MRGAKSKICKCAKSWGLSLSKKTSEAWLAYMRRLGLEPTGEHEADMKKLKESGKVPRFKK